MVEHERFENFLESISGNLPEFLENLEVQNISSGVPIIRKSLQNILKFMLVLKKPEKILEVGTGTGFSALLMLNYINNSAKITTIEKMKERAEIAAENFKKFDSDSQINLITGDAITVLEDLVLQKESFDFIFMDAAKGQYINFLPSIKKLLSNDGILITDNILQEGSLLDSRYTVIRRDRTIHSRMREYIKTLVNDRDFETIVLESGDGVSISVKRNNSI